MKDKIKKFADFWFSASWVTKAFLAMLALMVTFRLVTSCIKIGIIDVEIGCVEAELYDREE